MSSWEFRRKSSTRLNNFLPLLLSLVGFVDLAGGDYRLAPTSPYKNAGTDGKDVGCDFDALKSKIN